MVYGVDVPAALVAVKTVSCASSAVVGVPVIVPGIPVTEPSRSIVNPAGNVPLTLVK
jgi:hypothetical protein